MTAPVWFALGWAAGLACGAAIWHYTVTRTVEAFRDFWYCDSRRWLKAFLEARAGVRS